MRSWVGPGNKATAKLFNLMVHFVCVILCTCAWVLRRHMAAAGLGCKGAVFGIRKADSCPGCINALKKRYSHFVGGLFLTGKAVWVLNGCLLAKNTNYCMLVNEWAWLKS